MVMVAYDQRRLKAECNYYTCEDIITRNKRLEQVIKLLPLIGKSDCSVLICGETGTGKDLVAKVIHNLYRRKAPFIKVNCAALPENLLESELFGYAKGAFTGADADRPGRFQLAHEGTIFLDEIGDMPLALQAKLLMVLDDKEFYPLGSRHLVRVDTKVLAATNQDLRALIAKSRFREDLFHRLNVVSVTLPPLRDRREDIPLLIKYFMDELNAKEERKIETISEEALHLMLHYNYPGNVRELKNWLNHAFILCQGDRILPEHLLSYAAYALEASDQGPPRPSGVLSEREIIIRTLEETHWKKEKAARQLGIDRTTLWRKMKKYGIS